MCHAGAQFPKRRPNAVVWESSERGAGEERSSIDSLRSLIRYQSSQPIVREGGESENKAQRALYRRKEEAVGNTRQRYRGINRDATKVRRELPPGMLQSYQRIAAAAA